MHPYSPLHYARAMQSSRPEDIASAVHEAARAVIGRVLKLNCGGAEVGDGGVSYAVVHAPPKWDPCAVRNWLCMSMAAAEAERKFLSMTDVGDREDLERQERMAARVGLGPSLGMIRAWAGTLVEQDKESMRTVARALLERRRLAAEEIDAIWANMLKNVLKV